MYASKNPKKQKHGIKQNVKAKQLKKHPTNYCIQKQKKTDLKVKSAQIL